MKITKITKLKKNLYNVILENGEIFKLYEDVLLKYDLLIDKKINEESLSQILFDNKVAEAYNISLRFLNIKMRTEEEVKDKLKKVEYTNKVINEVIKRLRTQNYINDEIYVNTYIKDQINLTLNGPYKIKRDLLSKKMDEYLIDKYLGMVDTKIWNEKINKIIEKRAKVNKDGEYVFKTKTTNYLLNQGFESELITFNMEKVSINTKNNLEKTAQKEWLKLSKKYKGNTLIYKFKSNMFKKGFCTEDINDYLKDIT